MVGERGVDVVLNSLTSDGYIAATVEMVAENGRFMEIGKRNIWSKEQMYEARPDIYYETRSLNEILPSGNFSPLLDQITEHIRSLNRCQTIECVR